MNSSSAVPDLPAPIDNIYLIGYRGTGKTTAAKHLAARLGMEAIDADEMLERRYGRSISRVFAEEGETGFRNKEAVLFDELCGRGGCVIATGGGVILRQTNRARLQAERSVFWLQADAATIWQRLQQDASSAERRPTLTIGGLAEVEELLRVREPLYRECSRFAIDSSLRSPEEVADIIMEHLQRK